MDVEEGDSCQHIPVRCSVGWTQPGCKLILVCTATTTGPGHFLNSHLTMLAVWYNMWALLLTGLAGAMALNIVQSDGSTITLEETYNVQQARSRTSCTRIRTRCMCVGRLGQHAYTKSSMFSAVARHAIQGPYLICTFSSQPRVRQPAESLLLLPTDVQDVHI